MSCNSCAKGFSLLRKEKGCPGCGFSYCSKCLNNKVFLPKLNSEAKVCAKCQKSPDKKSNVNQFVPPDAYYKRLAAVEDTSATTATSIDDQIQARLKKLKEADAPKVNNDDITNRLQAIKGGTSDAEMQERLAKLKGMPVVVNKPVLPVLPDLRTEEEQANDLMKQYVDQTQIYTKYKDAFDNLIGNIETRMQKLKGTNGSGGAGTSGVGNTPSQIIEPEDEEESVRKIVEKLKAEASMEDSEIGGTTHDELPFCEICNEDATLRCLGCRYLFCKRCYLEHEDPDDGCNRYTPYKPPKEVNY